MSDQKERTIKQLPPQERPYEKCLKLGCRALSDAELLAVIIRTGSVGDTSVELARRVLSMAGAEQNITGITGLSVSELTRIRGIGTVKAVQI